MSQPPNPPSQQAQTPAWFYYNENGQKTGPISASALKALAKCGVVKRDTTIENINGRSSKAGDVRGFEFPDQDDKPQENPVIPPVSPQPVQQADESNEPVPAPPASVNPSDAFNTALNNITPSVPVAVTPSDNVKASPTGTNVNMRLEDGSTPLHVAVRVAALTNDTGLLDVLIKQGNDVNLKDGNGDFPLHLAVKTGNSDIVSILLEAGSDTEAKDSQGKTALEIARQLNKPRIVKAISDSMLHKTNSVIRESESKTPALQQAQVASWLYYTTNQFDGGIRRFGPVTSNQLKQLAAEGRITPETLIENVNGRQEKAGNVRGLNFTIVSTIPTPVLTPAAAEIWAKYSNPTAEPASEPVFAFVPTPAGTAPEDTTKDNWLPAILHIFLPVPFGSLIAYAFQNRVEEKKLYLIGQTALALGTATCSGISSFNEPGYAGQNAAGDYMFFVLAAFVLSVVLLVRWWQGLMDILKYTQALPIPTTFSSNKAKDESLLAVLLHPVIIAVYVIVLIFASYGACHVLFSR